MKLKSVIGGLVAVGVAGAAAGLFVTRPATVSPSLLVQRTADLANGEVMFNVGGCASCHKTEGQEDRLRLGGGHALKTPFGNFLVPNISMDPKVGMGAWTEQEFLNAMLKGTGRRGEHLFPAFPYASYQRMKIEDVRDLFAYMRTLLADPTPSKPHEVGFPFNVRLGVGAWKLLYLDGKPSAPNPALSPELNRGAYLVEGPGHCAECHSSRNMLGGIIETTRLGGGPDPLGKAFVPNLTQHPKGLAKWSKKDIEYLLETGFTPENDSVGSTMADVIVNTSKLSATDRAAMSAYIKALPPREGRVPDKK